MIKIVNMAFLSLLMLAGCTPEQEVNAFVKGSFTDIQHHHQGTRYIIMFWSEDCAYCGKEFSLFDKVLEHYPKVKLITVATDPFLDRKIIQQKLESYNLQMTEAWVFADPVAEKLYFDVEQGWRGELPLTYLFDEKNTKTRSAGLLKGDELMRWLTDSSQ